MYFSGSILFILQSSGDHNQINVRADKADETLDNGTY